MWVLTQLCYLIFTVDGRYTVTVMVMNSDGTLEEEEINTLHWIQRVL